MRAVRAKYLRRECRQRYPDLAAVQPYTQDSWCPPIPMTVTYPAKSFRRVYQDIKRGKDLSRIFMPGTARRATCQEGHLPIFPIKNEGE